MKFVHTVLFLVLIVAGCAPAAPKKDNPASVTEQAVVTLVLTAEISTVVSDGSGVATAEVGTVVPVLVTEMPPDFTPPPTPLPPTLSPIPVVPGGYGPTELKYRVLEHFPDLFFCDPDFYPVARDDELALALQRFPEIESNPEEFEAILAHNNLAGRNSFSDEQKLLIYREHKKLRAIQFELDGDSYRFQLQSAKTEGEGELISGRIDSQGTISAVERTPTIATCPICLAAGTRIDTPGGPMPVEDLRPGMPVWTLDRSGRRVVSFIARIGKIAVPSTHQVVHLILEDKRELWVSPGHPTVDGRRMGLLRAGDWLNGARISAVERVPYSSQFTYDLLPEGETGFYWANGILMASTLK